jgi:hypothetical protein
MDESRNEDPIWIYIPKYRVYRGENQRKSPYRSIHVYYDINKLRGLVTSVSLYDPLAR